MTLERESIGLRAADANVARNLSRDLDMDIDKMFPPMSTVFNKQTAKERKAFLNEVNDALLSGKAEIRCDEGKKCMQLLVTWIQLYFKKLEIKLKKVCTYC